MKNKTVNFWNIENEHVKNLIFFFAIILISLFAILASSVLVSQQITNIFQNRNID